ncbi:leucyl aminopeptidase family protein [Candidatus Planktophila sulfonica]|uniref:leucyl aminopeptidase family protein n=1 Tax=Candidatus Planktophila sulfonica TaxID=1884904 RepID=UPI001CBD4A5A|nr:leucyl aminopeptidase family protein [Candidatus Planktophila sulfonica]
MYLVGAGDGSLPALRTAGAALGKKVRGKAIELISLLAESRAEIRAHGVSILLGAYSWNLKTGKPTELATIAIATKDSASVTEAGVIARALYTARDLIHTPSNIKNPLWMAEEAKKIADEKGLAISVLSGKELAPFGGLRAVGNSSPKPGPRFIELTYIPKGKARSAAALPHVVIVGKGITFDTGGVSLKRPYEFMTAMKSDMAGAAAALATISALPDLQPQVKVTVLMMCAENALSGTAQRPSDVITQYGGTTVEIINTDAEGRLVLADGLAYAVANLDPDYLFDIATLTGSATLGLGRQYAALYSRDNKLAQELVANGESSGERVWQMPLIDDYADSLESDVADLNHAADKGNYSAGSVTAALYLEHFVGDARWVHLDIAGTGRSETDSGENAKGGTGFGVRFFIDWILSLS